RAAKDLAFNVKYLADAVRRGYKLICSEPSAALCLKDELKYFVAGEDVKLVSENTFELMSYLLGLFKQDKLKPIAKALSQEFIYHSPCHLKAISGDTPTIELLDKLCGITIVNLKAGCCGIAGTFGMQKKNYDLAWKISQGLRNAIKANPSKIVLTECGACKMQIEHISGVRAVHPIKVLAEIYQVG
ncbi:MAG: heterodisulfide reductase-related iron-sulfur binding cluster, partial [Planctomycetota bacterium]